MRNTSLVDDPDSSPLPELAPPDDASYFDRMPELEEWVARSEAIRETLAETLAGHSGAVTHAEWEAHMERFRERCGDVGEG